MGRREKRRARRKRQQEERDWARRNMPRPRLPWLSLREVRRGDVPEQAGLRERSKAAAVERLRRRLNRPGGGSNYVRRVCASLGIA